MVGRRRGGADAEGEEEVSSGKLSKSRLVLRVGLDGNRTGPLKGDEDLKEESGS